MAARHILAGIAVVCCVNLTLAAWTDVESPFADANTQDVVFISTDRDDTRIRFKEEMSNIKIAIMRYEGDTAPNIVRFENGKNNDGLGAEARQEGSDWYLYITLAQDYETVSERDYAFFYDTGIGSPGHRVSLLIENINDMTPVITPAQSECKIKENEILAQSTCEFTVFDGDGMMGTMSYTVFDSGNPSALFDVVYLELSGVYTNKIALKVNAPGMDYEAFAVHILTIGVTDAPVDGNTGETNYVVQVIDVADTPPFWRTPIVPHTLLEEEETTIQVTAADGDLQINAEIGYKLTFDNDDDAKFFSINDQGTIHVAAIDRDVLDSDIFVLNVVAFEVQDATEIVQSEMFVIIEDINDNIPKINANTFNIDIDEGTPVSLNLGLVVTDPDLADSGQFTIELVDKSGNSVDENFLLVPTTGYQRADVSISVRNTALDYEDPSMRVITLQLIATEKNNPARKDTKDITINLVDLNDEYPVFSALEFKKDVWENAKKDDVIIQVLATDTDAGDVVKHSLTSQTAILNINETTGAITVASANAFDYERQIDIIVQVLAEDSVGHKTYVQLAITVQDVNDTPPTLQMPSLQPTVTENAKTGTAIVADISATDVDTKAELAFDIDWDQSFATKQGARVLDTALYRDSVTITTVYPDPANHRVANGVLKMGAEKLDWEAFDTLSLSIVVTDQTTLDEYPLSKTRSALLALLVVDENDEAPIFTDDSRTANRTVIEGSRSDQLIGTVIAVDADGPGNNDITYSIVEDDPNLPPNLVKIDSKKGELRVAQNEAIDCDVEYEDKLNYLISATDGLHTTLLKITIDIIDQNDNVPQYDDTGFTLLIPENSPSGTPITTVSAHDSDFSAAFHTVSYFINSNEDARLRDLFKLDEVTGVLSVDLVGGAILDRDEGTTFYVIPITFRDNYNQGSNSAISLFNDTRIILNLEDENDNDPIFPDAPGCLASPLESVLANDYIYRGLYAADKDDGDNAKVSYSVVSFSRIPDGITMDVPEIMFAIDTTTDSKGDIKVTTDLLGLWGDYRLELRADDHGPAGSNRSSVATYKICVKDINNHDPVIQFPVDMEVIRLKEEQEVDGPLLDTGNKPLKLFTATDEDFAENAEVTFRLTGTPLATVYFTLVNNIDGLENTAQLQLVRPLEPETITLYDLTVSATDNGDPQRSHTVQVTVVIIKDKPVEPEFSQRTWDVSFMENDEKATATIEPVATDGNNDHLTDPTSPEWDTIYYYIIDDGSVGLAYFNLDKDTGVVTLTGALDREEYANYTFQVLATNSDTRPNTPADTESLSQLTLRVEVGDENDNPPRFDIDLWPGGISTDDRNGKVILTITAVDPDLDDAVTYNLLKETMIADPSLDNIKDKAFQLSRTAGDLILDFDPDSKMSGFFQFLVEATDSIGGDGHFANTTVKIFMISDFNRVTFKFNNDKTEIDAQKFTVSQVFTDVIGFDCAIDSIIRVTDDSGIIVDGQTEVTTHFIDTVSNQPVASTEITAIVNNRDKMIELKKAFFNLEPYPLELVDYNDGSEEVVQSLETLLKIILIVVSVVLGLLVILLFAAFFIKTRSLNRRLEALSTTKFGSQDSGLNRIGMNVPGANKHAIEGSNPVWNEDIGGKDFDNISQGSNDSDLIGVEERPEFASTAYQHGSANSAFAPDNAHVTTATRAPPGVGERRQSINPLSTGGGTLRGLSHQMSIDSQDSDEDDYARANSHFSYAPKADVIPITDL